MDGGFMGRRVWIGVICSATLAAGGCYSPKPPPFDPRALQQAERESAFEVEPRPMRPLPQQLESPYHVPTNNQRGAPDRTAPAQQFPPPPTGPEIEPQQVLRMPLQEVIQRAVANNQEVRVAGFGPAIEQTRVVEAQARFDPAVIGNIGYEHRDRMTPGTFLPNPLNPFAPPVLLDREETRSITGQAGLRQFLPAGGQWELTYRASRTAVQPQRFNIDPAYENDLVLQVTQPLLRDFGREINRARITVARRNQHISLLDFRRTMEDLALEIERLYWELSLAEEDVRIQEELLERTDHAARVLRDRGEGRPQLPQTIASMERRRSSLIRSRSRVHDLSDQLKRLMNDPDLTISQAQLVLPSVDPIQEPVVFDLPDQVATALENRAELAQQQLRVDSAAIITRVSRNNLLPALNLVGSVGVQGVGESPGEAFREQRGFDAISYGIGIQLEIPIGNRAARAIQQRSMLQQQQAIQQYRNLIDQVALEVKLAARDVETSWSEIRAARNARLAARDAMEAIELQAEDLPELTATWVQLELNAQAEVAETERAEAAAIANYNVAIARLERAKGTILRYNNVILQEEPRPFLW
jgi:outer membrane protein